MRTTAIAATSLPAAQEWGIQDGDEDEKTDPFGSIHLQKVVLIENLASVNTVVMPSSITVDVDKILLEERIAPL